MAMDIPLETIKDGMESLEGVSGRFEKVENRRGIHVIVDYAHTHDALERVLLGLKEHLEGVRLRAMGRSSPSSGVVEIGIGRNDL